MIFMAEQAMSWPQAFLDVAAIAAVVAITWLVLR